MLSKRHRYHLPALRSAMGDWIYYTTAMKLPEVAALIGEVEEIHPSQKLCEYIQRTLNKRHSGAISQYLKTEKSRFFSAIVVGVYGGSPKWSSLEVSDPQDRLSAEEETRLNETVGILTLSGI